jgi:hypothetical protein
VTVGLSVHTTFTREQLLTGEIDVRDLLRTRGAPEYRVLMTKSRDDHEKESARQGRFVVFPTIDVPTELTAPVDWLQDPFSSFSWRAQLHSLRFLDALFQLYLADGYIEALDQAQALALDWIEQNEPCRPGVSEYAWFDRLVGDRVPYLAYLLAAAAHEERVSASAARKLLASVIEHADALADDENYTAGTNHGLFQDAGLLLAAYYVPFLVDAETWRAHATARFIGTLSRHVNIDEAIHLEHSPSYHADVTALGQKIRRLASVDDPRLNSLIDRLADNAGWFVMPDGRFPPMGDTDYRPALAFARASAEHKAGLKVFPGSGWAFVREADSYLIVSAGYHSKTHKHADDLSFCLHERGSLVVTEVGKYGYDEDETRSYALSSRAHNVVLVDGQSILPGRTKPCGSGIRRAAARTGWYAIDATNGTLEATGINHRRMFLFKPGLVLVIIDELSAGEDHTYTRLFHLGPEIEIEQRDAAVALRGPQFSGWLSEASLRRAVNPPIVEQRIVRGQTAPHLKGWTFPEHGLSQEIYLIEFESTGANELLAATISLTPEPLDVEVLADGDDLRIVARGQAFTGTVTVKRSGDTLALIVEDRSSEGECA